MPAAAGVDLAVDLRVLAVVLAVDSGSGFAVLPAGSAAVPAGCVPVGTVRRTILLW